MTIPATICIIGTGYTGMASAIGFAACGYTVVGYDKIRERIIGLRNGVPPYNEAGLSEKLAEQIQSGRLRFAEELSEALSEAKFIIVAVDTPASSSGETDLSSLQKAIASLQQHDIEGKIVVLRSTVPPGTTGNVAQALAGRCSVVFSPEFLREGSALSDFMNPDRIVIGSDNAVAAESYKAIVAPLGSAVYVTTFREAELIKYVSNAYLAMKISFANEVADLCERVGASAPVVLKVTGSDHRIGSSFLMPGIGFGGPCFEKDLQSVCYEAERLGACHELFRSTLRVNKMQQVRIVKKLTDDLGEDLSGLRIGIWGLTFKAGTDDIRHSLALNIIHDLINRGATIRAFDPTLKGPNVLVRCEIGHSAIDVLDADALLVLTEWREFSEVPLMEIKKRLRRALVVDGRNILDGRGLEKLGVRYKGVGYATLPIAKASNVNSPNRGLAV